MVLPRGNRTGTSATDPGSATSRQTRRSVDPRVPREESSRSLKRSGKIPVRASSNTTLGNPHGIHQSRCCGPPQLCGNKSRRGQLVRRRLRACTPAVLRASAAIGRGLSDRLARPSVFLKLPSRRARRVIDDLKSPITRARRWREASGAQAQGDEPAARNRRSPYVGTQSTRKAEDAQPKPREVVSTGRSTNQHHFFEAAGPTSCRSPPRRFTHRAFLRCNDRPFDESDRRVPSDNREATVWTSLRPRRMQDFLPNTCPSYRCRVLPLLSPTSACRMPLDACCEPSSRWLTDREGLDFNSGASVMALAARELEHGTFPAAVLRTGNFRSPPTP